jgi:hypothetical protein
MLQGPMVIETARTADGQRREAVCRVETDSRARGTPHRLRRMVGRRLIGMGERLAGLRPSSSRI